jgi:predicted peptidase
LALPLRISVLGLQATISSFLIFGPIAAACASDTGFVKQTHQCRDGQTVKYTVFVPPTYSPGQRLPVILFLHGIGESGTDGHRATEVGIGPAVRKRERTFPAIVVIPQAQKNDFAIVTTWFPSRPEGTRALEILAAIQRQYQTDPDRVYLTGVSMGGFGTWAMASAFPEKWAAIVPICGGGDRNQAGILKTIPCWCFHGSDDNSVQVGNSRSMIEALRKTGGNPRYTEYDGVGHDCWNRAYSTDELWEWLWQQKRK